ncbi:methyl-accepting chemotaxis protein [Bacillus salitolerans]|uniref:Methyl-accepting chemotaxis protein n=1 Tax=Bacillus salitolerans TaxID=1437434 RepID=A0ABW4LIT7_9BACI
MAHKKPKYKFGLQKKLVVFTAILALVTYSTSAFFIQFVYGFVDNHVAVTEEVFTFITFGMGIFWSAVLAYFAASFITKPLKALEHSARKAAEGQINEDVPLSNSDDEIRSLAVAFNQMLGNLREMVKSIDTNFKRTNGKVIEISAASASASEQSEAIARTIDEISKGAETSAVAIQDTAQSIEEVSRIAERIQVRANTSKQLSNEMVHTLDESKKVINSLISGIQKLADSNQVSLTAVNRLEENAKKVENIISLVGDIAGQTNLLALNASIEAARAGEHGKGFAVVAEEVRSLADESSKAVQGITGLIHNIQAEVKNVVVQIKEQVKVANLEAEKGTMTNKAIAEMANSVHQVADAVDQITELVRQQMENVKVTSTQSQDVAAIAEETSASALEVASSTQDQTAIIEQVERIAKDLAVQANELKKTIERFTI